MKRYILIFFMLLGFSAFAEETTEDIFKPSRRVRLSFGVGYTNYVLLSTVNSTSVPTEIKDKIPGFNFGLKTDVMHALLTGISIQNDDIFAILNVSLPQKRKSSVSFNNPMNRGSFLMDFMIGWNYPVPVNKYLKFCFGVGNGTSLFRMLTTIPVTPGGGGPTKIARLSSVRVNSGLALLASMEVFFSKRVGLSLHCTDILTLTSLGSINHTTYDGEDFYSFDTPFDKNFSNIASFRLSLDIQL